MRQSLRVKTARIETDLATRNRDIDTRARDIDAAVLSMRSQETELTRKRSALARVCTHALPCQSLAMLEQYSCTAHACLPV